MLIVQVQTFCKAPGQWLNSSIPTYPLKLFKFIGHKITRAMEVNAPLNLILCSIFSFVLGAILGQELKLCVNPGYEGKWSTEPRRVVAESLQSDEEDKEQQDLSTLVSAKFSCNPYSAFERLSRLHKNRVRLDKKRKKGEANRARTATIVRKAGVADAEESAFRNCLQLVLPEVLEEWDQKAANSQLSVGWDEGSEKKISGITFTQLEESADELESSL
ncbi:unnamed protein product [Bathycoccus prasinos]